MCGADIWIKKRRLAICIVPVSQHANASDGGESAESDFCSCKSPTTKIIGRVLGINDDHYSFRTKNQAMLFMVNRAT